MSHEHFIYFQNFKSHFNKELNTGLKDVHFVVNVFFFILNIKIKADGFYTSHDKIFFLLWSGPLKHFIHLLLLPELVCVCAIKHQSKKRVGTRMPWPAFWSQSWSGSSWSVDRHQSDCRSCWDSGEKFKKEVNHTVKFFVSLVVCSLTPKRFNLTLRLLCSSCCLITLLESVTSFCALAASRRLVALVVQSKEGWKGQKC